MNAATDLASGANKVVVGPLPKGTAAEGGGTEAERADVEDVEETKDPGGAEDITMTGTGNTTTTETEACTETEMVALATNHLSAAAQLFKVVHVDHCHAGDRSPA